METIVISKYPEAVRENLIDGNEARLDRLASQGNH